ncbi:MAG: hypothetical protein JHC93_00785 [Parachlamydiales bacterium]|nr:hypothetical protein [Parachlamydiales bacterium]
MLRLKPILVSIALAISISDPAFATSSSLIERAQREHQSIGLSPRQPHWKPSIVSFHPNGQMQTLVFYDSAKGAEESPVRQIVFYADGNVKSECDLKKTSTGYGPDGLYITYGPNGNLSKISIYKDGVLDGESKSFYDNGQLHTLITYVNGVKEGHKQIYYNNGDKEKEAKYHNDQLEGECIGYYPDKTKASYAVYHKGLIVGKALKWDEKGALLETLNYCNGLLQNDGNKPAYVLYHPSSSVAKEKSHFLAGILHGVKKKFYENGKESYSCLYERGHKQGNEIFYAPSGKVLGEFAWVFGTPQGSHVRRSESGQVLYSAHYDSLGNLTAPIEEFDEQGTKRLSYWLCENGYDKEYKEWDQNGSIVHHYNYNQGVFDGVQKEYYPSQKLHTQAHYTKGLQNGLYEEWNLDGVLLVQCNFINGQKDGRQRVWFNNKKIAKDATFVNGKINGSLKEWHENGQLAKEENYVNGQEHGPFRSWNEKGDLVFEMSFDQGLIHGVVQEWFDPNHIRSKVVYNHGKKEGLSQHYLINGQLCSQALYKDDLLNGLFEQWYESGQLQSRGNYVMGVPVAEHVEYFCLKQGETDPKLCKKLSYVDGKMDGEQKTFHPNGATEALITYSNGELEGPKSLWDSEGNLQEEAYYSHNLLQGRSFMKNKDGSEVVTHYKDGLKEGLHQVFYPIDATFGKIKAKEAHFVADELDGEFCEYNRYGIKVLNSLYNHGLKEGITTLYGPNGKVMMNIPYKNDKREGLVVQYFSNGKIFKEAHFSNDQKEGVEKTFHPDGSVASIARFHCDKLQGLTQQWNEKGLLVFEGEYQDGMKNGKFNKYDNNGKPKSLLMYKNDQLVKR